jgi:hypothetical protein
MRGGWEKVNSAIRGALEQVTLADMMGPPAWAESPPGPLDSIGAGPGPARRAAV